MSVAPLKQQYDRLDYEYNTLMSAMHVSVSKHLLDEHFTVLWGNDYYYSRTGYTREEYETRFHNRVSEHYRDDPGMLRQIGDRILAARDAGEKRYEVVCRMPQKDGAYIWIKIIGTFTDEFVGGKQVIYCVFADITDLVRAQQERTVAFDSLPGFVARFRMRKNGMPEFIGANERFVAFFGKRPEQGSPCPLYRLDIPENREAFAENMPLMQKGEPVRFVIREKNRQGEDAWLQLNAECIDRIADDPVYLVIYLDITDVTELRDLQKKLEERTAMLRNALEMAERANQVKSDFLARMSHDIRTPMNAITGLISIARDCVNDPVKIRECLNKLEFSSGSLLSLINDILDMSKIESGRMELKKREFSFVAFIDDIVSAVYAQAQKKRIGFHVEIAENVRELYSGDALKLKQIVSNLLSNAIKFTDSGGRVELQVEEGQRIKRTCELVFTVSDNGIGMEPDVIERVFLPFEQDVRHRENRGGSGLGLAIVHSYVQLMNGRVDVESEPGKGSRFVAQVWLDPVEALPEQPDLKDRFAGYRALLVDERSGENGHTAEALARFGVETETVFSDEAALDALEEARRNGKAFDLLLLSWKSPVRKVTDLVKTVRNRYSDSLSVGMVTYHVRGIRAEAQKAGIVHFLQKPLFPSTVYEFLLSVTDTGASETTPDPEAALAGRRVLLVEDNDINREIAQTLLQARRLKVDTAGNGQEAVEKFLLAMPGSYLAILMDVQMPVMNGLEATRIIRHSPRADAKTVPVIGLSANAFEEDIEKSLEAGMNAYLAKPIDVPHLFQVLQHYSGQRKQPPD
ncbi:PAS domain-containing hybrid sensor histidine kinase/response regulator [Oxalobacter paraformigenes]|uniref:Virulence sensor protein BvgS n=1 Tax=Oxalobacter paraformigenes TaxID=556268 RepID=C3X2T2_9BURK|nr:PAS domain-containing hybrid sensor histidine kinase/response regulator [Oxalobacter paraformigenes]EEO27518.2 PAS domain S-box protein [Oxalobacter paraformigenes]